MPSFQKCVMTNRILLRRIFGADMCRNRFFGYLFQKLPVSRMPLYSLRFYRMHFYRLRFQGLRYFKQRFFRKLFQSLLVHLCKAVGTAFKYSFYKNVSFDGESDFDYRISAFKMQTKFCDGYRLLLRSVFFV